MTKQGRVDKSVDAHKGVVTSVRWSHDGSALATGGEDGAVKVWSKGGMLRTVLAQPGTLRLGWLVGGCVGWGLESLVGWMIVTEERSLLRWGVYPE